jgi:hypothetical protein
MFRISPRIVTSSVLLTVVGVAASFGAAFRIT